MRAMPTRHARLAMAAAVLSLLAACGSEPLGPSAANARLDLQDRFDTVYRGMIELVDFRVTRREILAEDRIRLHITTRIRLNKARAKQFKQQQLRSSRLFGYGNFNLDDKARRFYKRFGDQTNTAVLLYQRTGAGVWTLTGVRE